MLLSIKSQYGKWPPRASGGPLGMAPIWQGQDGYGSCLWSVSRTAKDLPTHRIALPMLSRRPRLRGTWILHFVQKHIVFGSPPWRVSTIMEPKVLEPQRLHAFYNIAVPIRSITTRWGCLFGASSPMSRRRPVRIWHRALGWHMPNCFRFVVVTFSFLDSS